LAARARSEAGATIQDWPPHQERVRAWGQTPDTLIPDPASAEDLINRVGLATVYAASSEVANLFHAYVGDGDAKTDSK
jgi:hypothetical protein